MVLTSFSVTLMTFGEVDNTTQKKDDEKKNPNNYYKNSK